MGRIMATPPGGVDFPGPLGKPWGFSPLAPEPKPRAQYSIDRERVCETCEEYIDRDGKGRGCRRYMSGTPCRLREAWNTEATKCPLGKW